MLEREGEAAAHRTGLAEDRQIFRAHPLDPLEALAMDVGVARLAVIAWNRIGR